MTYNTILTINKFLEIMIIFPNGLNLLNHRAKKGKYKMSYRTFVNGIQIFGNDDYFPEWIEFIKTQKIKVNKDGSYEGEITNIQGMFETLDKIVKNNLDKYFRNIKETESSLDYLVYLINYSAYSYIWTTYQAIQDVVEKDKNMILGDSVVDKNGVLWWSKTYPVKLKEGCKIISHAN